MAALLAFAPDAKQRDSEEHEQLRDQDRHHPGVEDEDQQDGPGQRRGAPDEALIRLAPPGLVEERRERDRKAKLSPQELAPEEPIKDPLTESWSALSTKLTERERRLWEPPDTKGIQDEKELMSYINQASYALDGQYAAPSPTVLADIEVVKRKTAAAAAEQKAFFDTEVKAFLDQLEQMALPLISR